MEVLNGEPYSWALAIIARTSTLSPEILLPVIGLVFLIICSGLVSGSEVAFFSINGSQLYELRNSKHRYHSTILKLLKKPRFLLSTILIANNIINIAIVILFTILSDQLFGFRDQPVLTFLIDIVAITFILVLLGEVLPKVYANQLNIGFASFMAYPMFVLNKILYPLSLILVQTTSVIENKLSRQNQNVSVREIKEAIDITADEKATQEEKKILKGIVNFGNISVKQIMTARIDVVAYEINTELSELVKHINEHRFSRIPVYENNFDHVEGILYIKDLLPHLDKPGKVKWQKLLRQPYFVPQNKKIDDLLREFQQKKVHMAIVVDEYGGSSGIVTMEDILEEIVGEIHDEFDDDEIYYSKLDENNFVFDGKTSLNDFTRILGLDEHLFEDYQTDVESLGGLLVEILGKIPGIGEKVKYDRLLFTIESADRKRVRRVKVTLVKEDKVEENNP